ncbi:endonuclease/exonuclease/phosphatase family protein [Algibacter lectus]|jgi:hypothetical protein|uniref:endonuclease/exonuclease/phosphatase family protein n=1 Tax=Algibacter lectus TaxID=221126 RepID=UPI0026E9A68F|nr:endonuclease/exonuclease/phosphatase family protein [Algibacter lectus]MDO7137007.1 endonuclease/exonuclease/phosphatase family protein [Algibacter lectus]
MVGSKRRWFKIILKVLSTGIFIVNLICVLALLVLHFLVKDASFKFAYWFYLFPLPIIITIVLVFSVFLGKRRKYNLILAGVLLLVWFFRSFSISFTEEVKDTDVEVVFWNASRDDGFESAFKENESIPDIMVLSEPKKRSFDKIKAKYPQYYFYKSNGEIEIFSKTPLHIEEEQRSKYSSTIVKFSSAGIQFYAVDMQGSFDVPKAWEFKFANNIIQNTSNTIVLGDFNAPYESVFLDRLEQNYNHFFSKKGNGFRETWPWNFPLLSIDHIWVSKDLTMVNSEKIATRDSDHSMIKTVIRK